MDTIIGRIHEKQQLQKIMSSKTAEFVAVYGRRRVVDILNKQVLKSTSFSTDPMA